MIPKSQGDRAVLVVVALAALVGAYLLWTWLH